MPLHELLVDARVRVIPHLADLVAPEPDDGAGALVHDVPGIALEPALFPDLDDHALVGLVPLAPHVLISPLGRAEARLAIVEAADDGSAPLPLAADRRCAGHPVDDVVREVARHLVHLAGEQSLLVGPGDLHALAHTVISAISSGSGRVFALRPARSMGLSISALCWSMMVQKSRAKWTDRKSTRLNSSHVRISYAVFCLKKKQTQTRD